ncbi:DUF6461 domain-containing protein [Streptomyces sp. NBC_01233]|uniref:DUF6461 domain-containing protein n=1 Tax=Streptomyces sp. NBC_01233 TaxID=2903787 RepID=UPI002E14FB9E|nr:hypothetical protein OG332_45735 [Streptomyces sp. NBC_01233]
MIEWMHESFPGHEVNIVFARGTSLDVLTERLIALRREPLASGEDGGWAWAVHDMANWEIEDYDPVDYRSVCSAGTELVVFVTEPCSAKAHGPQFEYYRDGRTVLAFSFEDVGSRVGDDPDYLSPELLAAGVIGPDADCPLAEHDGHDCFDSHFYDDRKLVIKTIAGYFALTSPPLSAELTGAPGVVAP